MAGAAQLTQMRVLAALDLRADGRAEPSEGNSGPAGVGVIVGACALGAVVAAVVGMVVRRHRQQATQQAACAVAQLPLAHEDNGDCSGMRVPEDELVIAQPLVKADMP